MNYCRCIVGEFVTEGEGNGKKSSKTEAALLMIEKLKDLPPVASCQKVPKKKSTNAAAAAAAKKKSKNLIKLEQKANPDYGQSINPISRLIQIQQAKKQKEPVYTLIAERGMPRRREFVMEVRFFFNIRIHIFFCVKVDNVVEGRLLHKSDTFSSASLSS